ncbi:hypothetical protein GUJ93_ZPchr0008g13797 [Zizania palustris]|uniref:Uncharacterized protein n=1 Tax=Zizania palustris TaxID=103762 RepID=A0A8J5RWU1_ZIZPA|nr:hypothetical protein GUJ93_ZPchr0008g13797 [Zizania palustris]
MVAARLLARISRQGTAFAAAAAVAPAGRRPEAAALLRASAGHFVPSCSSIKVLPVLNQPMLYSISSLQRFGFSSSAPQQDDKETNKSTEDGVNKNTRSETEASNETNHSSGTDNASQADTEGLDLSKEEMIKLVLEKEDLLKSKDDEIKDMKDRVLRSYAEVENVIARTKRESENTKKYAVQGFSKGLLDVADNLSRASSVVKESFSKIDTSNDSTEAVKLLKTLLEGVEMTEKHLTEVRS